MREGYDPGAPRLRQAPRYRYAGDIADGTLAEVLPCHPPSPTPISVLYPKSRQLSPRARVFIDWLVETVALKLRGSAPAPCVGANGSAATGFSWRRG